MDNNTEKQEPKTVSRRGLLGGVVGGVRNLFSPNQSPKATSIVSSSEQPKKERSHRKGVSRRGFLKAASVVGGAAIFANAAPSMVVDALGKVSGTDNNIVDPIGPVDNSNGFPPKGLAKTSEVGQERREQQIAQITIIGVPSATLTEAEKTKRDAMFSTDQNDYAGLVRGLRVDGSRITNLPFDAGSDADKLAQKFAPLVSAMQNAGVEPSMSIAEDEKANTAAPTLTFIDTGKPFILGSNSFPPGTSFEMFDGQIHYMSLTARPGGEKDKIMVIPATAELKAYVSQFGYDGSPLKIADDEKYLMAQVASDGTVVGLISKDRPYFFVPISDTAQPTATPSGSAGQLPPPMTEVPQEILAKTVSESAAEFDARIKETYKDLWLSKDAKVKYVDSSHFSIDGKTYKIDNPFNIVLDKFDTVKAVEKSGLSKSIDYDVKGTFIGIVGTRVIDDINIQTSDGKYKLDVKGVKVLELSMLTRLDGKDYLVDFEIPEDLVFQTSGSGGGKFTNVDSIFNKMTRGAKVTVTFPRGINSQQDWIDESFKVRDGEVPSVFGAMKDEYNKALALVCSTSEDERIALQELKDNKYKDSQPVDIGSPWSIISFR